MLAGHIDALAALLHDNAGGSPVFNIDVRYLTFIVNLAAHLRECMAKPFWKHLATAFRWTLKIVVIGPADRYQCGEQFFLRTEDLQ